MPLIYYISHPDVIKSPDVPVPRWPLSARGRERMAALLARPWVSSLTAVYCSDEQKALDGAAILAGHLGLTPIVRPALGEVDRSSTGYLPEEEHAAAARALFERPDESARGWETARYAQERIVRTVEKITFETEFGEREFALRNSVSNSDVAIVAHGAVGTFYLCYLKGVPISMAEAQPGRDGGYYYCFDTATHRLIHGWTRIDEF
jgi:broad specificity phosphatase PhoE